MKLVWSGAAALALFLAMPARAAQHPAPDTATCGTRTAHWVHVTVAPEAAALGRPVIEHLQAGLRPLDVDVCTQSPRRETPARVFLSAPAADQLEIAVEVSEGTNRKRASRVLDVVSIPADGRALTIALALEELLRASWATLALLTPTPRLNPPPPPPDVRAEAAPPPARAGFELGAFAPVDWYAGGQTQIGAELRGAVPLAARLALTARFGARWAAAVDAPDGEIRGRTLQGGLGARLALAATGRAGVDLVGRADLVRVTFEPRTAVAAPPARSATTVVAAGGVGAWVALGAALRAGVEATLGAPLRPVRAADRGDTVTAVSGVAAAGGLGLSAVF